MQQLPVLNSPPSIGSLEPFLLLPENRFAFTAAERLVSRRRPPADGVAYVYGPSGVGKTHLLRSVFHKISQRSRQRQVAYLTASEFAAQFAEAAQRETIPQFQQHFRTLDVLLCEDVSALENRYETQRQLISVLDEIVKCRGRCLITCRCVPGELTGLLPRLLSRFRQGVSAAISLPEVGSRQKLLTHFADRNQIPVSKEAVHLLADALPLSPRELLGNLRQLETNSRVHGDPVDIALVKRFLGSDVSRKPPTLHGIARAVSRHFGTKLQELRTENRSQETLLPRHCAMYLARELTDESMDKIAAYFGRRNHSTVIHACRRINELRLEEPTLRQHLTRICNLLGQYRTAAR